MTRQRVRHDCGGYLDHETDWLGRTVEHCNGCPYRVTVVARMEARRVTAKTQAAITARREAVFRAVPVGKAQAVPLKDLMTATGVSEVTLRVYLQTLMSGRRVKTAVVTRPGKAGTQRMAVYWRNAAAGELDLDWGSDAESA